MERNTNLSMLTEVGYRDPTIPCTTHSISGKHALGDRARKLDQGVLITRFELPFNIWW